MLLHSPFHSPLWPPCWSFTPPRTFLPPGLCIRSFLRLECFYLREWHGLLLLYFRFLFNCHLVLRHSLATHSKISIFSPFFLFLLLILLFSLAVISYAIYLLISHAYCLVLLLECKLHEGKDVCFSSLLFPQWLVYSWSSINISWMNKGRTFRKIWCHWVTKWPIHCHPHYLLV